MSKTLTDRKQDQAVVVELRFMFPLTALLVQSDGQNETCSFSGLRIWQSNGAEFKHVDAPKRIRSMYQAIEDLGLLHLYVIYPGSRQYALSERITVLPVQGLGGL
ncbi:MAG: hypothetical protein NXI25_26015 [bacterium]|nr:hypothetical protein [bacterium]